MGFLDLKDLIIIFFLSVVSATSIGSGHLRTIPNPTINETGLTVTSFSFNSNNQIPSWVNKTFGAESVYFNKTVWVNVKSTKPITEEELKIANNEVTKKVSLMDTIPVCSAELLGFMYLDRFAPFKLSHRSLGPIVGNAVLYIPSFQESWVCFYRGMYENWRQESRIVHPNFWAVAFYCPQYRKTACDKFIVQSESSDKKLRMVIAFEVTSATISNEFTATLFSSSTKQDLKSNPLGHNINLGICAPIPYTTIDSEKYEANGVMITEWIRYYVKLGIKVFLYDRDGENSQFLNLLVGKIDPETMSRYVIYYNYTIKGFLDPSTIGLKYDNNELQGELTHEAEKEDYSPRQRIEKQGNFNNHTKLYSCLLELIVLLSWKFTII